MLWNSGTTTQPPADNHDTQEQALLEAIHRVVRSNAPDAYAYLCDKLPLADQHS